MKTWQLLVAQIAGKKPSGRWILLVGWEYPKTGTYEGDWEPKVCVKGKLKPTKRTWQGSLMKKESHTVIRQK